MIYKANGTRMTRIRRISADLIRINPPDPRAIKN